MNILFLHSGLTLTGSVTYAASLARAWRTMHRVYWANDGIGGTGLSRLVVGLRYKLFPRGILNSFRIARFIRAKKIHLIHSHSRRANLAAALSSLFTGIPYVTSVHMRTRVHYGNRLLPCWGERTIAICENIAHHLEFTHHLPTERIHLIRNGIDLVAFPLLRPAHSTNGIRWITVLGRLSGKRWDAAVFILSLLEDLLATYPDIRVHFVGWVEPKHQPELDRWLARLNPATGPRRVQATGHVDDPRLYLLKSTLVIGAGRSLLEALAMGLPVVAVGEQADHGLLTADTFREAQKSNFGDFPVPGAEGFDAARIRNGIDTVLQRRIDLGELAVWGRERISEDYNLEKVAREVNDVYISVVPRKQLAHA